MKHSKIDAYRIGYRRGERRHHRRIARHYDVRFGGALDSRSPDRWGRTWQAEWEGCQRAPRAWTRLGVIRKAIRWQRRG